MSDQTAAASRVLAVCAGPVPENLILATGVLGVTLNVTVRENAARHLATSIYDALVVVEPGPALALPFRPWSIDDPRPVPLVICGHDEDPSREVDALEQGAWDYFTRGAAVQVVASRLGRVMQIGDRLRRQALSVDRLTLLTRLDDVTGLHNQGYLRQRLSEELARARRFEQPLAVMVLDIDRFKQVNDTHDHLFGTFVLQDLARLLRQHLRRADVLCRYGGDEFVAILPHIDLASALVAAERAREVIGQHEFADSERSVRLTASFGVAAFPEHDVKSGDDLLRLADHAMYVAKRGGRDCCRVPVAAEPALTTA